MSENVDVRKSGVSRRAVIGGVAGLGVGVPLIAACGSDEGDGGGAAAGGGTVGKTSEVPVGGGKIFTADKVVVTQPTAGDFKAFSAVCTHQQCVVTEIVGGNIDCTCHGSKFSITDGSNVEGPNKSPAGSVKPLEKLSVTVKGDDLVVT